MDLGSIRTVRERLEQLELAVEASPSGMLMTDDAGTILLVNREIEKMFGWTRGELIGQSVEMLVPERYRWRHPVDRQKFVQNPAARPMGAGRELYGLRKDGSEIEVEIALNPIRTERGLFILSSVVDISARRKVERALQESEESFRLLVEGVRDYAILRLDPRGTIESWNGAAERMYGYSAEAIVGQSFERLWSEEDRSIGRPGLALRTAASEGRFEEENWRIRKNGSRFLAHIVLTALKDERGRLRGFAKVLRDVTGQRRLEEQLRQAQKMEAIGTLAGGIAHDFNNILGAIVGYTELVHEATSDPELRADAEQILKAADRGRVLVSRIMTFSRRQEQVRKPTSLETPLHEALELLRASLPTTIALRHTFDPATPPVLADATQLHQVVMNLATNSSQAMPAGGTIEVTLSPFRADETFASMHPGLRPGIYARLTVRDDGTGMPDHVRERVFDPFFTTKAPGAGTGLGLSVVHGIVEAHAGAIELHSEVGAGTMIDIFLPGIEVEATVTERPAAGVPLGSGQHVLVVDDEDVLVQLTKRILERLGYEVTEHTSSASALDDFERRPEAFDLVITDNTMPQITGITLAQRIIARRPDTRIILMTGLGELNTPEELRGAGIRRLLMKPVTSRNLGEAVHQVLAEP